MINPNNKEDVACQWCGEKEFDAPGLKLHLQRGWCPVFEAISTPKTLLEKAIEKREEEFSCNGNVRDCPDCISTCRPRRKEQ